MELSAVGRVNNVDELDFEPITVPVIGYTKDKKEVEFKVRFRKEPPIGYSMEAMLSTHIDPKTKKPTIDIQLAMRYLDACVEEDCRDEWMEFLKRPDVTVRQETLADLYSSLMEVYSGDFPTPQPPASHNGRVTPKRTTRAAAKSTASTSGRSR